MAALQAAPWHQVGAPAVQGCDMLTWMLVLHAAGDPCISGGFSIVDRLGSSHTPAITANLPAAVCRPQRRPWRVGRPGSSTQTATSPQPWQGGIPSSCSRPR